VCDHNPKLKLLECKNYFCLWNTSLVPRLVSVKTCPHYQLAHIINSICFAYELRASFPGHFLPKHVHIINSSVIAVRMYKGDGLEDEIELSLPFMLILQPGRIWHRLHLKFRFWQSRCVCGPCDWNRPTRNTFTTRNWCPVWCSSFYSWHFPYYGPYCRPTLDNGWCSWRLAIVYSVKWQ